MISRRQCLAGFMGVGMLPIVHSAPSTEATLWDVIVVGSGVAGLSAASTAKASGAKRVLVLEKGPLIGGHSLYSSGSIPAVAPKRGGVSLEDESVEQFVANALAVGGGTGDPLILAKIGRDSAAVLDWLESLGIFFGPPFVAYTALNSRSWAMPGNSAGRSYVLALAAHFRRMGGEVRLSSGVTGLDIVGEEWRLTTDKATYRARSVVIASGGFTANVKERMKINPLLTPDLTTSANPTNMQFDGATGEMIRLAQGVGAAVTSGFGLQALPFWGGRLLDYAGADIYVDARGHRFVNENLPWNALSQAILQLPERRCYVITDGQSYKGATLGVKLINGTVSKSSSVAEMAKGMGVDGDVLAETIRRYNQAVDEGYDQTTGKNFFRQRIEKPPFYWGEERIYVHTTLDGLKTNERAEVLKPEGRIIRGLYAAGEVVGGIFGQDRLGGAGMTACFVMGCEAGRQAAAYVGN